MKKASRPRNFIRATAYATGTDEMITPNELSPAYRQVFQRSRPKGIAEKTSRKLLNFHGDGHSEPVPDCCCVMNAVVKQTTSGRAKPRHKTMGSECSATPMRNRRGFAARGVLTRARGRLSVASAISCHRP